MKKMFVLLAFLLILTVGCSSKNASDTALTNNDQTKSNDVGEASKTVEVTEGDFIYRLVSEKGVYDNGEDVKLYAELEYIGADSNVTIYHAASPFLFPMHEKTRNYEISYGMDQPLIHTTLENGEPLREEYGKSGGYDSEDDAEYIKFIKQLVNEGFPEGHYTVNGIADFYVTDDEGKDKIDYTLKASVDFRINQ